MQVQKGFENMKKLLSASAAIIAAMLLTSCAGKTPVEDCKNTNIGTGSFNQIMQTENGYYYNATMFGKLSLRYHDNATGSDIYLCAKPECTHNGDKFCTATSRGFKVCYSAMYGEGIYISAIECDGERMLYKLLRASCDGTELTEVCTFLRLGNSESAVMKFNDKRSMVIHRGTAFVPYIVATGGSDSRKGSGLVVETGGSVTGMCGTALIDLASGKFRLLTEYDRTETHGPGNAAAEGDYFYYSVEYFSDKPAELHRYNIKTEKDETLDIAASLKEANGADFPAEFPTFAVIDGRVWYILTEGEWGEALNIYIYDPENNRTELAEQFSDKLYEFGEIYDENGEISAYTQTAYEKPEISYDGESIYIAENGFFGSAAKRVHIFTTDGEKAGDFAVEESAQCQINILDGKVYVQTAEGVKYCSVSDIIGGNTSWTELYKFEEEQQ